MWTSSMLWLRTNLAPSLVVAHQGFTEPNFRGPGQGPSWRELTGSMLSK